MIEARIVEASDTFSKNLGVRLAELTTSNRQATAPGIGFGNRGSAESLQHQRQRHRHGHAPARPRPGAHGYFPGSQNVNLLPAGGIGGFNPGTVAIALFNKSANNIINLELTALEADGKGKIISSPRVLTADKVEALIEQGTEIPYQQATSSGATSVSFRKANLALKVKPQITPDGNIIMTLDVNKDAVGPGDGGRLRHRHQARQDRECWSRTAARW